MSGLPRHFHFGPQFGPEPTWRTASTGAKIASLAVLALLGSVVAVVAIPVMAIVTALLHP